jgi:tetratricopeptide (TPR) repeat protein
LLWLAAFYLPVSGIVIFPSSPMADRYLYVPAIGLWIVAADQAIRFFSSSAAARRYAVIAVTLLLLVLAVLTIRRNMDWKSDVTLFARLVEQYPDNAFGHAGLGEAYFMRNRQDEGELKLAEQEFAKSLAQNPLIPGVHTKIGYIRLARGDSEGAVHYYTIALGLHPSDKEARLNRGIALENLGRQKDAINDFKHFLAISGNELADARPYAESRIRELSR